MECFCRLKCLLNICRVRISGWKDETSLSNSLSNTTEKQHRTKTIYRGNDIVVPCLLFLFIQKHFSWIQKRSKRMQRTKLKFNSEIFCHKKPIKCEKSLFSIFIHRTVCNVCNEKFLPRRSVLSERKNGKYLHQIV